MAGRARTCLTQKPCALDQTFGLEEESVETRALFTGLSEHLFPPAPIAVSHVISPGEPNHESCFDIELELDGPSRRPQTEKPSRELVFVIVREKARKG